MGICVPLGFWASLVALCGRKSMVPSFHVFAACALKSVYGSNILNYYTHPAHFAATTRRYTFLGFRLKFTTGHCYAHVAVDLVKPHGDRDTFLGLQSQIQNGALLCSRYCRLRAMPGRATSHPTAGIGPVAGPVFGAHRGRGAFKGSTFRLSGTCLWTIILHAIKVYFFPCGRLRVQYLDWWARGS